MTHTYKVTGMTCEGCKAKVNYLLSHTPGVQNVDINLTNGEVAVTMDKHIATSALQEALKEYPKYKLSEEASKTVHHPVTTDDAETKSWLATYKPILLIFGYITIISLIAANTSNGFNTMLAMRVFI